MVTCKRLPVFLVDWQLFEEPPKCKYRRRCECCHPQRHKDDDPCPLEKSREDRNKAEQSRTLTA